MLRPMRLADVEAVLDVQQAGAVRALGDIFPQAEHPFPRDQLGARWRSEVLDTETGCYVVEHADQVAGFVAVRGAELLHFGTAVEVWGSGLASVAHDETLELLARRGVRTAWLRVFEANSRARRFYERLGWRSTGERSRGNFAPYPTLLTYEVELAVR